MILSEPLSDGTISLDTLGVDAVAHGYVEWMNDSDLVSQMEARFSSFTSEALIDYITSARMSKTTWLMGINAQGEGDDDPVYIGNIKLGINPHHNYGDLGLIIGRREYWGQGIGGKAITLMSEFAFSRLGLNKLVAGCYSTNIGSRKAFETAGFVVEATRSRHCLSDGKFVDVLLLAKFRS